MRDKYLTTWKIPGGETSRQIGYIFINSKYRDTARTAQNNAHWLANMGQNQQRRVQKMQLYYNAAQKYKISTPSDTGKMLKYDIRELRIRPGKLTQWYQEQEQAASRTKNTKQ